jgi:hypothetical protein
MSEDALLIVNCRGWGGLMSPRLQANGETHLERFRLRHVGNCVEYRVALLTEIE